MDLEKLLRAARKLLAKKEVLSFPGYVDKSVLSNDIGKFFIRKIESIRSDIDKAVNSRANMVLSEDPDVGPERALLSFHPLSEDEVLKLLRQSAKKAFVHLIQLQRRLWYAAFDTVDHGVLLNRLSTSFGVRGSALQWFISYLLNRSQRVFRPKFIGEV